MPFFSKVFRARDSSKHGRNANDGVAAPPPKPRWEEAWSLQEVTPAEVQELIHECTQEMKSRALDMPFLLLPFRPGTDPVGSKSFIRKFFRTEYDNAWNDKSKELRNELMLMEPIVLCGILKWCWSRLPGGVVTWETYELFRTGESDSKLDRSAFTRFIPISVDSEARKNVIFDFFDLLAAIAARVKTNGLGGRKLSRMAGWWAFEHSDNGEGFNGGYESWKKAANATSHLFFAYLRSLSPNSLEGVAGITQLPRSLQALLAQTEYPPEEPHLLFKTTARVAMIVNSVSPTPFALLRRAKHFEYRDDDPTLHQFSEYDDPVQCLTDECKRVLNRISATNQSAVPTNGAVAPPDGAWSRFEDVGFSSIADTLSRPGDLAMPRQQTGLRSTAASRTDELGRPTTPSWADFLSSGFGDDAGNPTTLLPPDKQLPPLGAARGYSSQSHLRSTDVQEQLDPGELAAVHYFDLDETFWWVWMTSLADEETPARKAVFGRCALIETSFHRQPWLVVEEQVKGASPGQDEGAYIAEKKSRFSFTKRSRLNRKKTTVKKKDGVEEPYSRDKTGTPMSRIDPDKEDKVKALARQLSEDQDREKRQAQRRGRTDEGASAKTNSVLTLQPMLMSEAARAMKWTSDYDKGGIKSQYLNDPNAGKGISRDNLLASPTNGEPITNGSSTPKLDRSLSDRELPSIPREDPAIQEQLTAPSPPPVPESPPTPLPQETGKPLPVDAFDEKPKMEYSDQHPALRKPTLPEATESYHQEVQAERKPKKSGFKKLFGRKKDEPERVVASPTPLEQPAANKLQKSPPKDLYEPVRPSVETKPQVVENDDERPRDLTHNSAALDALEGVRAEPELHEPSVPEPRPEPTRINTAEQVEANKEFSRFDQGPLDDMPAFVPEDDGESATAPSPTLPLPSQPQQPPQQEEFQTRAAKLLRPEPEQHQRVQPRRTPSPSPAAPAAPTAPAEEPSSASAESKAAPISPSDRWAQIRKNAAERAQRMTEEQSSRSRSQSAKTEDGETSGEETIESRVARIKARVAELTGNMDTPQHATGARR